MKNALHSGSIPLLFVLPGLGTGGSERVVLNLCRELRDGFRPVVAALRGGELAEEFRALGVSVHILNRRGGIDLRLILFLYRLIRTYQIRVINTHHFVSLFYAFWASRMAKVALVHTEHSRWEMERLPWFWRLWLKFFLGRLESVTAVSREAFFYLSRQSARTSLIQNGVDTLLFARESAKGMKRQELGLAKEDLVVGSVGNLRPEKNQGLLIRALALLPREGQQVKAVLVGDGPCRGNLESLARELGVADRVLFLGTRHDVSRLYGVMDIYCLSSRYEGLPLTLLEAMACSRPIIGTDVLGIRGLIRHGHNGLLVADDNPEELKDALILLGRNPELRRSLADQGCKLVAAEYSFARFVSGYRTLFQQLGGIKAEVATKSILGNEQI